MSGTSGRNEPYDAKRALSYCMWLLGRRMYTEAQLRDKLRGKGTSDDDIERTLNRLRELHLTDDGAFADAFVRGRKRKKGPIALRRELRVKGVGEADIATALEPLDDAAQLATASALLEKHAWRFDSGDPRKDRAKAYAFLARRGFTSEVVRRALERAHRDDA